MQRFNAKRRGVPFRLSFEEWLTIWKKSGHLPYRGKGDGKYCMARHGDKGAYEVGNVKIITHNQNSKDFKATPQQKASMGAWKKGVPHTKQHARRISLATKGRVFSEETRRKMSASAKLRVARMPKEKLRQHMKMLNAIRNGRA